MQYAKRNIVELDRAGGYYARHVAAMTEEGLHSKSDIAAELGWRDALIASLTENLNRTTSERDKYRSDAEDRREEWLTVERQRETIMTERTKERDVALGQLRRAETDSDAARVTIDVLRAKSAALAVLARHYRLKHGCTRPWCGVPCEQAEALDAAIAEAHKGTLLDDCSRCRGSGVPTDAPPSESEKP